MCFFDESSSFFDYLHLNDHIFVNFLSISLNFFLKSITTTALGPFPARKRSWRHGILAEPSRNHFFPHESTIWGPGDPGPERRPRPPVRVLKNQPKSIASQGRDFIYIDDVIRALILTGTQKKNTTRHVFNVSSGTVTTLNEVIQKIRQASFEVDVTYTPEGDIGDLSYCCDPSRFSKW